ncbi:MAG: hypothetical protein H8D45_04720 [Bacteroidetes bacterium]|nr:hypothetical protein [Bacteroidota bacterium]
MNKNITRIIIILVFSQIIFIYSCSEDIVDSNQQNPGTLLYERNGLIDSLVGTCSTFLIRNFLLDTLDFESYGNIRVEFDAFTDGDLSTISMHYIQDSAINVFEVNGLEINSTRFVNVSSPNITKDFYLRLKLFSSICTGQEYVLSMRDLKSLGIKNL